MKVRQMRVLMVEASGRGFLNHYSHALSLGLHWAGVDVQLLTGKRDELKDWTMPFHKQACLDSGRSGWRCLRKHIVEEKPDVVKVMEEKMTEGLKGWSPPDNLIDGRLPQPSYSPLPLKSDS